MIYSNFYSFNFYIVLILKVIGMTLIFLLVHASVLCSVILYNTGGLAFILPGR